MGKVLGGSYQIDIVSALVLEAEKEIRQLPSGKLFSKMILADGGILAEETA